MATRKLSAMIYAVLLFSSITLLECSSSAQTYSAITQNMSGVQPYQAYDGVRENIDLATGNVNIQLTLLSLPGRNGHNLDLAIEYDSKVYGLRGGLDQFGRITYWWQIGDRYPSLSPSHVGWRLALPQLEASTTGNLQGDMTHACAAYYVLTMADGSTHKFGNVSYCNDPRHAGPSVTESNDNAFILLDTSSSQDTIAILKDGTKIYFSRCIGNTTSCVASSPWKIEDPNGNYITFTYAALADGTVRISTPKNTVGRIINFNWQNNPDRLTSLSYLDVNGSNRNIGFSYAPFTASPSFVTPTRAYWEALPGKAATEVLSGVTLPTGKGYTFTYNGFGEMTKITYPAGGYTSYVYGTFKNKIQAQHTVTAEDFREITERHVCRNATGTCATEDITTYTPTVDSNKSNNQYMDVVDPLGNKVRTEYSYASWSSEAFIPRVLTVTQFQGSSTQLKTVSYSYTPHPGCGGGYFAAPVLVGGGIPTQILTTLNDTNQVSAIQYDYDTYSWDGYCTTYIDNPIVIREYGFGSGAPGGTCS